MINDLFSLNKEDFWRKINRMERTNLTVNIDIHKIKEEYSKLFNESNRSKQVETEDKLKVDEFIKLYKNETFKSKTNTYSIQSLIDNLALGKATGLRGISNEMLKYKSSTRLVAIIAKLFDLMINHKVNPELFNISCIKPIIKDPKKPTDDISNTRPVAISDVMANMYERTILNRINVTHMDAHKQFGFKTNSSCSHAVFVLKAAARIAKARGQRLYACAIDASKAFDKVSRSKLWLKLIEKQIAPELIIAIYKYYENSLMLVQIDDEFSELFLTINGVRQGGAISSKLFSVYVEKMISRV